MKYTKQHYLDAFRKQIREIVNIGARKAIYQVAEANHPEWDNDTKLKNNQGWLDEHKYQERYIAELESFISQMYDELTSGETEDCLCHCHQGCKTDIDCSHCRKEQSTGVR